LILSRRSLLASIFIGADVASRSASKTRGANFRNQLIEIASNYKLINVRQFGAHGDGISDDTVIIQDLDAMANSSGKCLYFPAGTYLINPLRIQSSWIGDGSSKTIIKYLGREARSESFVSVSLIDNVLFCDICFDGSASSDPINWDGSNFDRFSGASGLSIEVCRNAKVIRCAARNMVGHGIRMLKVQNGCISDCEVSRCRGKFGDGIIMLSCEEIDVRDCHVRDYTRIGIVADRTDRTEPLCRAIDIFRCSADNGHNSSALYGGTEFNAGVWIENCVDAVVKRVKVTNNTHRGISVCSGQFSDEAKNDISRIFITECIVAGCVFGICTYSLIDIPVMVSMNRCRVSQSVIAFQGACETPNDIISWRNCYAEYDAAVSNGRGFAVEVVKPLDDLPKFLVGEGCVVTRSRTDYNLLNDNGSLAVTSDIGAFFTSEGPMNLVVRGVKELNGEAIHIRWNKKFSHQIQIENTAAVISCDPRFRPLVESSAGSVRFIPDCPQISPSSF